jgi:hydroxymethylpyrimidine/phosphomethylpyrimidine kinase
MVPGPRALEALWRALERVRGLRIVDPVTRTSRGERLSSLTARAYLSLAGPAVVLTPNVAEAALLAGGSPRDVPARDVAALERLGQLLVARGFAAVVVKGGHLPHGDAVDVVCLPGRSVLIGGARLSRDALKHRGTGCRFATALAVKVAAGEEVVEAARSAKRFVARYLRRV